MNRSKIAQHILGEPLTGTVVNKHCPRQGEVKHHTVTLRQKNANIIKVIVPAGTWQQIFLGDTYVVP